MATMPMTLPFDLQTSQGAIDRRRQLAQVLAQQALQSPGPGRMIGRHFVPTSPWEQIGRIGQAYMSGQINKDADEASRGLVGEYNEQLRGGLDKYFQTREGQKGVAGDPGTFIPTEDDIGYRTPPVAGRAAVAPNPRRAAVEALTSGLPALARLGQSDLEAMNKGALTAKDLLGVSGATVASRVAAAQGLDPSQLRADDRLMTVGDRLLGVPEGGGAPQLRYDGRAKFGDPFVIGGDLYQNDTGSGRIYKLDNAPKVTVGPTTVTNAGSKAGMSQWAELAAKTVKELTDGARASARTLTALNNVENSAESGVINGPLAGFGIFLGQLANSAGMRVDGAKLANSETFNSEVIRLWAEMMQANGGARGLVKEESEKMAASLPTLAQTPEGRRQIIRILRMKAQQDIEVAQQAGQEFARALQTEDPATFTFGLSGTMLPQPAMNPRPGVPGMLGAGNGVGPMPAGQGLRAPEVRNW